MRHRRFTLFWSARGTSSVAFQMMAVAIGWQIQDDGATIRRSAGGADWRRGNDRCCVVMDAIVSGFAGNQVAGRMRRFSWLKRQGKLRYNTRLAGKVRCGLNALFS
jgi:hypothetical protein